MNRTFPLSSSSSNLVDLIFSRSLYSLNLFDLCYEYYTPFHQLLRYVSLSFGFFAWMAWPGRSRFCDGFWLDSLASITGCDRYDCVCVREPYLILFCLLRGVSSLVAIHARHGLHLLHLSFAIIAMSRLRVWAALDKSCLIISMPLQRPIDYFLLKSLHCLECNL